MRTIENFHHTMLTDRNLTPFLHSWVPEFEHLQYVYGPEDGRVLITVKSDKDMQTYRSDDWVVIDTIEVGKVKIRRTACGAGCRCAAEISPL